MKKLFSVLLFFVLLTSAALAAADTDAEETTVDLGTFHVSLSSKWVMPTEETAGSTISKYFHNAYGNPMNSLTILSTDIGSGHIGPQTETFYKEVVEGMNITNVHGEIFCVNDEPGYLWYGDSFEDGDTFPVAGFIYSHGESLLVIVYVEDYLSGKVLQLTVKKIASTVGVSDSTSSDDLSVTTYQTDDIQFSISGTYLHHGDDGDYAVIGFDWTNISDEPIMFVTKLSIEAYQNGIEIDSHAPYDFDNNDWTKVLPGFGTTSYACFPISGSGDVVFVIDKYIDLSKHFEDIYITVNPDELPEI